MLTPATVIIVGFFAVLAGVILQRFRQALQDRRDLAARLARTKRRVWREVAWTSVTVLVLWAAYEVIERGGLR